LERKGLTFDAIVCPLHIEAAVLQMAADQVAHVLVIFD
jgi:hypothetical protein